MGRSFALELQLNLGQFRKGISEIAKDLGSAVKAGATGLASSLRPASAAARELQQIAKEVKVEMLAMGAAVGAALKGGADESTSYARANVILKASQEELGAMQEKLRAVADQTGRTYGEVAGALYDVASAGFKAEAAVKVVETSAKIAAATGAETRDVFNALATMMNNYGLSAEAAGDKLMRATDLARASMAEMGAALATTGPVASQFKISFDEVAASLALITNKGVPAAQAATQLVALIQSFTSPTGEAVETFDRLGIAYGTTAFQSQSLSQKLAILRKAQDSGSLGMLNMVFGSIEAQKGFLSLSGDAKALAANIREMEVASGRVNEALADFWNKGGPSFGKLLAVVKNLVVAIGGELLAVLQPVIGAVLKLVDAFRGWAVGIGAVVAAAVGIGTVVLAVGNLIGTLKALWLAAKAGYILFGQWIVQTKAAALAQTELTLTVNGTAVAVSRLRVAVSALATAYIGFQIGKQIAEWLGLADATDRLAKGMGTLGDKTKLALTFLLTGPAGWAAGGIFAMYVAETQRNLQEQKKHVAEINALGDQRIAKMTEEQQAMAKQLEQWGFTHVQASILAGDELKLLKALEAQVKAGKGNADVLELVERLRRRNAKALQEEAGAMDRNKSAADKLQEAKERLKKGEEEFLKTVEEVAQDVLKAREGEAAAEIVTLQKQLQERRSKLEANARDELAVLRDYERQKAALQSKGVKTDKDREELKRLEQAIQQHAANVARARGAILNAEEAYNLKLRSIYQKRFDDLRSSQDKEIAEAREGARAMLDAYEAGISQIDAKLNAIRSKRDQGLDASRAFLHELRRDALSAKDSRQAEIQDLRERAATVLLSAQTEKDRAAIIEETLAKAKRLADSTKEIAEAEKAVSEARAKTQDDKADGSAEEYLTALDEQKRAEKELAALREKSVERQKAVAALAKQLQDVADDGRREAIEGETKEAKLKDQRQLLEEQILSVKQDQERTVQAILDKYHAMEISLARQLTLEQDIAGARGGARGEKSQEQIDNELAEMLTDRYMGGGAELAVAEAEEAAAQSAEAARAAEASVTTVATAAQTMSQTIQTYLEPIRAAVVDLGGQAALFAQGLSELLPQMVQSIGKIITQQQSVTLALGNFGSVVLTKFGEVEEGFRIQARSIDSLALDVARLRLIEAARGEGGLAAQGF